jgi:hypothetical protein
MIIRESVWEKIRSQFTESEKEHLRMNTVGEVVCPRGWVIDEDQLPKELKRKIKTVAIDKHE